MTQKRVNARKKGGSMQSVWKCKVKGRLGAAFFQADRWADCRKAAESAEPLTTLERDRFVWEESTMEELSRAVTNGNVWAFLVHYTGTAASNPSTLQMHVDVLSRGDPLQFKGR